MSQDRYLNAVLTVIAVTLSILALAQFGALPAAGATEPSLATEAHEPSRFQRSALVPSGATSTLPLRWQIPYARHYDNSAAGTLDCATVVSAVGFGTDPILVEVEFFNAFAGSEGKTSLPLNPAGEPDVHASDIEMSLSPFGVNAHANTGTFEGYALVFADDPRIFVGAYLVCTEVGATVGAFPRSITNLSAFPVGQTLSFFQAATPGSAPMPAFTGPES